MSADSNNRYLKAFVRWISTEGRGLNYPPDYVPTVFVPVDGATQAMPLSDPRAVEYFLREDA